MAITKKRYDAAEQIAIQILNDARFRVNATFTLFGVTSNGEYTLLLTSKDAATVAERFTVECFNHDGLEVRVDGVRVNFNW